MWVIIVSFLQLHDAADREHDGDWAGAIGAYPASIVVSAYAFLASWFVGGLTCFHSLLISRNTTTYEHFRSRFSGSNNPYNVGFWRNWYEALLSPVPPRYKPLWEKQKIALGLHDTSPDVSDIDTTSDSMSPSSIPRDGVNRHAMGGSLPPSIDGHSDDVMPDSAHVTPPFPAQHSRHDFGNNNDTFRDTGDVEMALRDGNADSEALQSPRPNF